jgi:hypothetical protein
LHHAHRMHIGFAVGLLLLAGCGASVDTTALNAPPHPLSQRPAEEVEVYSGSPPVKAHVDLALIQADQTNGRGVLTELVAAIRERAGEMGCDAIVITGASERASGNTSLLNPGSHQMLATCIVYVSPGSVPTAPVVTAPAPAPSAVL